MTRGETDRRGAGRARTRLRPGKLLEADGTFIADCLILDRSPQGARIRVLSSDPVPETFRLVDEAGRESFPSRTVWTRAGEVGLVLEAGGEAMDRRAFLAAAGPYYAVR